MQDFSTPMMRQYKEIKKRFPDCLLFYRMGDFYELFMEDAHIGAKILNITLTQKAGGKDGKIPMAGIPYHAVDTYLAKLVKAGHKVAICEQLSPPNKKGLVKRDVIRVVTPGTMMDEKALEQKSHNYIVSISLEKDILGLGIADISTGFFAAEEFEGENKEFLLKDELMRLSPAECILPDNLYNDPEFILLLRQEKNMNLYCFQEWEKYKDSPDEFLKTHFGMSTLAAFGVEGKEAALIASAALLGYLQTTQLSDVGHIQKLTFFTKDSSMQLDKSTMINLELFSTIREHDTRGSLLEIIDATSTPMGGRLLKDWIKKPLVDKNSILKRHDAVEELIKTNRINKLEENLSEIVDIERILSRLSVKIGNARDLINLKIALEKILDVKKLISSLKSTLFEKSQKDISKNLKKVIKIIDITISEEPPIDLRDGNIIKSGVDKELDKLRKIIKNSKDFIEELEKNEKSKTGISSLKIRYNQVFGFYIEVSRANSHLVPKEYMRKQTLVNGERFITKELKTHEEIILTAQEKANEMEFDIFQKTLEKILSFTKDMQQAALSIAVIDCISNFANISQKYQYTRPKLLYSGEIRIHQGRHPVVERLLPSDTQFVPNDTLLDNINQSLILITGPNMAGKSVYIRQVATIALLSQIGCFVPASSAHLSIVDRIFVRSGASDVITSGLSTFMVEMVETANILHSTTSNSLIVMDEIGRGTSTYDGISIAWSVAEYLVQHFTTSPKTLFATHYHELQALEEKYPNRIKNFHMSVADDSGEPIFLHTLLPGGASHSFGVAVAKLAGIPKEVVENAKEMLQSLEKRNNSSVISNVSEKSQESNSKNQTLNTSVISSSSEKSQSINKKETSVNYAADESSIATRLIKKQLESLDVANMTPLEALNKLAEIKEELKIIEKDEKEFLKAD
ncbi:MAG TPA: DNA mismatch repair protein MutS [Patescibacteria group bacterium]